MDDFTRKFLTEWRSLELPFENRIFIAAVSGGADSVALLLVLDELRRRKKIANRFVVAHFNHRLRGAESDADAEFVRSLCVKFDFELVGGGGEISRVGNLEQNARFARYDFLRNAAASLDADGILTAHTINDQAETFLLNLMRGSGTRGLSGMRANSTFKIQDSRFKIQDRNQKSEIGNRKSEITLIRPLLKRMMRKDTENYCRLREIEPRSDAMNEDLSFSRVRVRKILLPLLKEFNPKIVETLARTAELLQLESAEKNALTRENGETEKRFETAEIALNELRNLSKSDIYAILRGWLEFNSGSLRGIELKHIEAVENLIFSRRSGKIAELPNGAAVVKSGGYLSFKNFKVEK